MSLKSRYKIDKDKYVQWRKSVFARDGYKCQFPCCNTKCKKINAHHIQKYASNIFLRFSINNGITLCQKCHKKITGHEEEYAALFLNILINKLRKIK